MQFENKPLEIVKTTAMQCFSKGQPEKNKAKFTLLWVKTAMKYTKIL